MSSQASAGAITLPPDRDARSLGPAAAEQRERLSAEPPRSFARQAVSDTFRRAGARFGLAWVAVLIFCGVFAPFLANSHPLLLKMDGHWSSPLLRHLTPADVVLLVATFSIVAALLARPVPKRLRAIAALAVIGLSIPLAIVFVRPPETVVFEQYRQAEREGRVQSIVRAPVPYSPTDYLRDSPEVRRTAPSRQHWFGVEEFGADILSRMIHAARIALTIGFIATGIAVVIGVIIGGLMGYFVGVADIIGMRLIEIFEAVPTLFLLITFVAVFGRNLYVMMVIIGLTSWTGDARFIRAEFLRLRKQDFVQAAVAAGLPLRSVIFRHMLPNGITPVLVAASFGIASAILTESVLSFLGLGLVQEPSWGGMLNQARAAGGNFSWWIAVFPGGAIFLTVFAYNLIGEALRDALDPKLRGIK
ncbi:MAG TPA: ABC transporter permease [Tepidisphaeraceae bacterium]|nr:ABC transporter permease [Tepidisphaeraceae bacterium]